MKKTISILLCAGLLCLLQVQVQAQDEHPRRKKLIIMDEQLKTERVAFLTEKIGLTVEEAQTFWPLYNEMDGKKTALFDERADIMHRIMEKQETDEKNNGKLLDRLVVLLQQEADLYANYDARFRKILPNSKVIKIYVAEFQFRTHLLVKMREKKIERK
ncbi:MAG: hypothetical protein LBS03_11280 [Bacteroidales bacterium]|jgi:hypothetical protein|nr:hypothetical protein [Bacteroidales bacterium]